MKRKIYFLLLGVFITLSSKAQWVVSDPGNLAQGIVNTTKQIVETSQTASNTLSNFRETVKIYEQSKKYYDALKSVTNLVKNARKVQKIVLMVGEISEIYVTNFAKMLKDDNYTIDELNAIAEGYSLLLAESNDLLYELNQIITGSTLSMNDSERLSIIDKVYGNVKDYRDLVAYYTKKNLSISLLRAKKKGSTDRFFALYGNNNEKYW